MNIRIAGTEYSLKYRSYEIYVQGCTRNCPDCHNPETHDFNGGTLVDVDKFLEAQRKKVNEFSPLISNIYVTGGDLLCLPPEVALEFSKRVAKIFHDKVIWLFTGADEVDPEIMKLYDVVKSGSYIKELKQEGCFPATSNQKLGWNKSRINACPCPDFKGEIYGY